MKNTNKKKIKKIFVLCSAVLIFALLSAGCSGMAPLMNNISEKSDSNYNSGSGGSGYYDYDDGYDYSPERAENEMLDYVGGDAGSSYSMLSGDPSSANVAAERKIIRDANITMEVEDVEKSYDNMLALLSSFGGYEAKRDMRNNNNGYPTIGATLKIPASKLDSFLSEIKKEGETISSNISSSDITDQYYDSKIRITTLEKTLENYYGFLENAKDVDEQLRVTRYINDITQEIEQLKGSINRWDSLVEYSTVILNLYRPYEAPVPEPEPREINWNSLSLEDMGWFISSGFLSVCNAIFSVLQWLVIAVITISPVIIPVLIILFVLIRRHKNKKKRLMQNMQNQNNIPVANQENINRFQ